MEWWPALPEGHTTLPVCRLIYKCAMCDTVFTHKPLLSSHFDQHLLPQRVSVFKCPSCPLLFAQKRTMLEHLKVEAWGGRRGLGSPTALRKWGAVGEPRSPHSSPPQYLPLNRTLISLDVWRRLQGRDLGVHS